MDFEGRFYRHRELTQLLGLLDDEVTRGVLLLGEAGAGKTSFLRVTENELNSRGRAAFFVTLRDVTHSGEVGDRIMDAIRRSRFKDSIGDERMLRSSAGAPYLSDTVEILQSASARLPSPVLLLDALDESYYPSRIAAAVVELNLGLTDWHLVVASRTGDDLIHYANLSVMLLHPISMDDALATLQDEAPELSQQIVDQAAMLANGNPLILKLLAAQLRDLSGPLKP